jgi:pilus assembly protein CpaB
MNTQRLVVLGLAAVAAGGAAFLVRGMLGGGTPPVAAKPAPVIPMSQVLVASSNLTPGEALKPDLVRWEKWPTSSVDSSFITQQAAGSEDNAIKGTVVRAPILAGQPIATTAIVHGDQSGFMAATLGDGMRAVSIPISVDSGAGGFILPNDRVDVILTRKMEGGGQGRGFAKTILTNLRVLAVDQTYRQEKDTRTVVAKTATVEVTPEQAEVIAGAAVSGQLSLSLVPLSEASAALAGDPIKRPRSNAAEGPVNVIRYGMAGGSRTGETAQ